MTKIGNSFVTLPINSAFMKICIATSTRADWGLLTPLAHALKDSPEVQLAILATNMHLLPEYGHTIDDIRHEGFSQIAQVPMPVTDASAVARVDAMAQCMSGAAKALADIKPDILVILGDRFEMLSIATAAQMLRIPVAHIAGGEVSEGAIDDNIRHAITKLSALHFTETEEYRKRVIQMGEDPARVINAGALGVWNILHQPLMTADELRRSLDWDFEEKKLILATIHPATLANQDEEAAPLEMAIALDHFRGHEDYKILVTYPNNDEGSEKIIKFLNDWAPQRQNVKLVKSLGMRRYLSMLQFASVVVGNSSSGIIEVPSMGIPTVDIGSRQKGRIAARSVIHCSPSAWLIQAAIEIALTPEWQSMAAMRQNPYANPDTVEIIKDELLRCNPEQLIHKSFYNL